MSVWTLECELQTCHTPVKVILRRCVSVSDRMSLESFQVTFLSRLAGCVWSAGTSSPVFTWSSLNFKYNLPDCGEPSRQQLHVQRPKPRTFSLWGRDKNTTPDIYLSQLDWNSVSRDTLVLFLTTSCGRPKGCNINYVSTHWEKSPALPSRNTRSR